MPGGAQSPAPKGQVVQIVSLPDGLKNNARAMRLDGEVVAQNKDGSVRIHTDQGDIDIQVRGKQPQTGAKVEVDLPAGNPPKSATIRPAPVVVPQQPLPSTQSPVTSKPLPQTPVTQQPSAQTQTPAQPNVQTPLDSNIQAATKPSPQPVTPATPQPTTLPPLTTGQIVQIVPLTEPVSSQPLPTTIIDAPDAPQTAAKNIVNRITTEASQAAQKIQSGLVSNLLQAVKSIIPSTPALTAQPPNITTSAPSFLSATQTQQMIQPPSIAEQTPIVLSAKIISITPPLDQRIFMAQPQAVPTENGMLPSALTPNAIPTSDTAAQPLLVTVSDTTLQNKPVISLPMNNSGAIQNFVMQASAANTPPGTQMTILPQPSTIQMQPATPTTAGTSAQAIPQVITPPVTQPAQIASIPAAWKSFMPLMQPSPLWPVMDDIFQSFYQATPQAAQILGRIIPSPANGQSFGPAILLFAAALKSGELQAWIGDKKLEMLQKLGKGDLVSRLSGETSSLSQNTDAASSDWKSYPIPLLYQNEISKVLFHVRREPDEEGKQQEKGATRFVMDVSLTRMGDVQLDALVRGNRVDLMVRTELPVSLSMQDAMRTAYAKALDNTNIFGDIGFQSDVKNFISVLGRESALASA